MGQYKFDPTKWEGNGCLLERPRLSTLPSAPTITGCSEARAAKLKHDFQVRQSTRRVARYWLETEQDFDMPIFDGCGIGNRQEKE
jgi:hypothetical protein